MSLTQFDVRTGRRVVDSARRIFANYVAGARGNGGQDGSAAESDPDRLDPDVCQTLKYTYQDGDAVRDGAFQVPISARPECRSVFLFAFIKSGSVLAHSIAESIFRECGVAIRDIPSYLFTKGIDIHTFQCDLGRAFPARGYYFSGFRDIPRLLIGSDALRQARKVVITRDPRDMLVSLYFSVKFSHVYPTQATPQFLAPLDPLRADTRLGIDEFCVAYAWLYNAQMAQLRTVLDDQATLVLRYEDFIYDKMLIGRSLCDLCGLDVPEHRLAEIVKPHDIFPESYQPNLHIRQVHPGDYRRQLQPGTIATLDASLSAFIQRFGYG